MSLTPVSFELGVIKPQQVISAISKQVFRLCGVIPIQNFTSLFGLGQTIGDD